MAFKTSKDGRAARRYAERLEKRTTGILNFVIAVAMGVVAYTDWVVVANVSLGYLYVLPLALSAVVNPLAVTIPLAVLCAVLTDVFGPPAETTWLRVTHSAINLAGFLIVTFLVTRIVRQRNLMAEAVLQQRDEYEQDLTLAAQVQRQVLPKPVKLAGFEVAATMRPARLLGGDYYDFYPISDDVMDVVIADVSGKGAAAALLMPSLAVALRLRAKELSGPAEIMSDLDRVLKEVTRPATFVTMFYARVNHRTWTLQYSDGGHNPPVLVRPATGEVMLLDGAAGPIMGILPDAQFSNTVIDLKHGDVLALYTDGVTEQENDAGEEFSVERLKSVLVKDENEPAANVVKGVADAVSAYAGKTEQADDLTVVVAKVERSAVIGRTNLPLPRRVNAG